MNVARLPIYPHPTPLFPGQILPVYATGAGIEPMLRDSRQQRVPLGVIFAPEEAGSEIMAVGMSALFLDVDLGPRLAQRAERDAVLALVVGQQRFRVLSMHQDRAYLEATVREWPWIAEPHPPWALVERVGEYLRRYVSAFSEVLPPTLLPEALMPDVVTLGVLGASLLQLPVQEKQRLLELPTAYALLSAVARHMRLQVPVAERLAGMPPKAYAQHEYISFN